MFTFNLMFRKLFMIQINKFVPANRIRNIFIFLGLTLFIILFIAFRLLRPERLVNPEVFSTVLLSLVGCRFRSKILAHVIDKRGKGASPLHAHLSCRFISRRTLSACYASIHLSW